MSELNPLTIEQAVATLDEFQTVRKLDGGWDLGWARLASNEEVIKLAERMLRDIENWEKGYAKHKAAPKGDADE